MKDLQDQIAQADKSAAKAQQHHQDVKDWVLIEKALAPDGIPGEILAGALEPVNKILKRLSTLTGYSVTAIGPEMTITAGGRVYMLLSESEKWRCDALIGVTIALMSQLN